MRFLFILPFAGMLAACHGSSDTVAGRANDPAVLTTADFEQSIGWGDADPSSLTTEKAHSGRWSVRVQPGVLYGYTFARKLGDLSATPLSRLALEGWVLRVASGSKAKLVVQVNLSPTDEKQVLYTAFPVEQAVPKFGEWTAVRVPLSLPSSAVGTNKLKLYLWNDKATAPTYLDDVTLRQVK